MEWNGLEWNHGVEWSGMDFSGGCTLVILGRFGHFWSFLGQKNVIVFSRSFVLVTFGSFWAKKTPFVSVVLSGRAKNAQNRVFSKKKKRRRQIH